MRKNILILITILGLITFVTHAQTKKVSPKTKQASTAQTPVKKTSNATNTSSNMEKVNIAKTSPNVEKTDYKTALGIKFIYGVSLTAKHFLNSKNALEGIVRYNGAGGLGSNVAFTGLYEYHGNIADVQGLKWYVGGGAYVNYFSWKDVDVDPVTTFGLVGAVGLEYKIKSLPLAISADWLPGYVLSDNIGFSAENGGIGIKYTFR